MAPKGQWREPLSYSPEEDDQNMSSNSSEVIDTLSILRRVALSKVLDPVPSWETSSSSSSVPPLRLDISTRKRKQRIRRRQTEMSFRMITATIWLFAIVGMLYHEVLAWSFGRSSGANASDSTGQRLQEPSGLLKSNSQPLGMELTSDRRIEEPSETLDTVIHIVHTRFMQNQPDLIELGLARLELFRDFTLRSLQEQSSPNFLWVIRTDPSLHPSLKEPLIELLRGVNNHLLVATNENPNVQVHSILSVDPTSIWSGDLSAAQEYLQPHSLLPSKVLESRLDSDDSVHHQFIEYLQVHAIWDLPTEHAQWKIWCASQHFEWQYRTATDSIDQNAGILLSMKDRGCISAGLTIGYTKGLAVHDLPPIKHQNLGRTLPLCKNQQQLHCLDYITLLPTALRARTPTSAGMLNVLFGGHQKVDKRYFRGAVQQEKLQDQMWTLVLPRFGFDRKRASRLRTYLSNHLAAIAGDNLKGQCSEGHSCKDASKVLLQAIIDNPSAFV